MLSLFPLHAIAGRSLAEVEGEVGTDTLSVVVKEALRHRKASAVDKTGQKRRTPARGCTVVVDIPMDYSAKHPGELVHRTGSPIPWKAVRKEGRDLELEGYTDTRIEKASSSLGGDTGTVAVAGCCCCCCCCRGVVPGCTERKIWVGQSCGFRHKIQN